MTWFPKHFTQLSNLLVGLNHKVDTLMANLTKLTADVDALTAAVTTAVTTLNGLSKDIADLKAQVGNDPALQASIDEIDAKVGAATTTLTDATTANPA